MEQSMTEYLVIINIIVEVLLGKNLTETFNQHIIPMQQGNVSKIKDICYGIIRNYYQLKSILFHIVDKVPKNKNINTILLIGIYEIEHTKKPHYAIVNELVKMSFTLTKQERIKNFVNAVMRNYLCNKEQVHLKINQQIEYKYNFPRWLINKLKQEYSRQYLTIIGNSNLIPKISLRVNLNKVSFNDYLNILKNAQIEFNLIDNKIVLQHLIKVEQIPFFKNGYVSIQDVNAQKLLEIINFNNGDYILDACCAPGGKICQILENSKAKVVGLDIDENRLVKVRQNLDRLGLNAKIMHANASCDNWWDKTFFDIIIADVPCSASGTIKRNPDIKLHRKASDIDNFVITQREIIINLWKMLKAGGKLVYITCSIFKEENHDNIIFFTQHLQNICVNKEINMLPTEYADGFYYCILEKINCENL